MYTLIPQTAGTNEPIKSVPMTFTQYVFIIELANI